MNTIRSYQEVLRLKTFEERFEYLKLGGIVGQKTFGFERYLNQALYHSKEWKAIKTKIVIRDGGCDLAVDGREIFKSPILHHINPITIEDIERHNDCVFDPDNLILTSHYTHLAIHYGDASVLAKLPQSRKKGDTSLWTAFSPRLRNF